MRGKGTKIMAVADRAGLPVAVHGASASPHEVTLVEATLSKRFFDGRPARLSGDKAYDRDPLDATLATQGMTMLAPHRVNRKAPKTQDGRPRRRFKRRWKAERLFAWRQSFRRMLVRHDYQAEHDLGFVHLGCMVILLRWCL
jgi:transposase